MKRFLCLLLIAGLCGQLMASEERPNILMLCIDDLNDWVGFLGGHPQAQTPHMDDLARKGVNFTNAHCAAPGCSPSRNAILLGVEPHKSGLYPFYKLENVDRDVLDRYTNLPRHLKENGYLTCGITKVFHNPDNRYEEKETWDEYASYGDRDMHLIEGKGYHPEPYNKRIVAAPASNSLEDFGDYRTARHAIEFLSKDYEKPFFLAVGFIRPHSPFIMPEENFDRFPDPIEAPPFRADDLTDIPIAGQSNAQIYVEIPVRQDQAWEKIRRGYLATISATDDNVGRVLAALKSSPYAGNTIIILWSDHGYHLGEKRTFSKFSLWNEATRTPFIIYDPRIKDTHGSECNEPVGLINIYRTVCALVGIEAPPYVDGRSLRPWLKDPRKPMEMPAMTTWGRGNYTLRTKHWRYTRYFDGTEELYDENEDPNEWTNLADNPEYASLKKQFADQWLPKKEAPQVPTGRELYNVADADSPTKMIEAYRKRVSTYKQLNLQPPLD